MVLKCSVSEMHKDTVFSTHLVFVESEIQIEDVAAHAPPVEVLRVSLSVLKEPHPALSASWWSMLVIL